VSIRGPFARLVCGVVALGAGGLAIAGGLELHGPGLIAVAVAGALAACLALGIAREAPGADRRSTADAAVQAAGWTIGALLVLSGIALVLGGVAAALAGVCLVVGLVIYGLVRVTRADRTARTAAATPGPPPTAAHVVRLDSAVESSGPVRDLSTRELGREWLRTGRLLTGGLRPADRVAVVRRRQEALDELELRDPAGFARWLAAGVDASSDPADYVHGEWTAGTDAA
jgi:hypothetical protein